MPTLTLTAHNGRLSFKGPREVHSVVGKMRRLSFKGPREVHSVVGKARLFAKKDGLPIWVRGLNPITLDTLGALGGSVKVDGVMIVGAPVFLYYRLTGDLIKKTATDANGNFTFSGLDRNCSDYFAVMLQPPFNALVFDRLTPIKNPLG